MPLTEDEKAELVAYLDGELDVQTTQAIEAKLAVNAEVRAELDALKQTWGMLDYLPKANPSPNFTHRTLEKLSLEKAGSSSASKSIPVAPARRWPWGLTVSWAAAILLAVGVGVWAVPHLFPSPTTPDVVPDSDEPLARYLRIVEKWRYYENVDDREFVDGLDQPDMFGEPES